MTNSTRTQVRFRIGVNLGDVIVQGSDCWETGSTLRPIASTGEPEVSAFPATSLTKFKLSLCSSFGEQNYKNIRGEFAPTASRKRKISERFLARAFLERRSIAKCLALVRP